MKIAVIGVGYVGLVQGTVLADFGLNVCCMDQNKEKIDLLKRGAVPIYEPGLQELCEKNVKAGRLRFSTDIKQTIEEAEVVFIAVGTPPQNDGSVDLSYVEGVASSIGSYMNSYKVIVNKSTVPVGTGQKVKKIIREKLASRKVEFDFDIVSNPEFLREGKAIHDCLIPDRVVIGTETEKAKEIMQKVYNVLYINQTPFVFTDIETAELIKYSANTFLAVKISFINEMALLAEKVGANVQEIARAMGMDGRISPKFLHAGPGFGGSCFPKDTTALIHLGKESGCEMMMVKAAVKANEKQKKMMVKKIIDRMPDLQEKTIGILGLSFKPETDDVREAPSQEIIRGLVKEGAFIKAFCPEGISNSKKVLADIEKQITYCEDSYEVCKNADAVVIVTEWHAFRGMDLLKMKELMKGRFLFDLRNIHVKDHDVRNLFDYIPIGRT